MQAPIDEPRRYTLTLVMTEKCNLRCSYCFEDKHSRHGLSVPLAINAITKAFQAPGFDELEIDFFGGEPFLAFDRIKEICGWVWGTPQPRPHICFATTNGTLVHGEIKDWLYENKERFVCGISLDGTPEMHNINRCNSFSQIDLNFFKECWPTQPVKMTVSPQTVGNLAEGVQYIHGLGFKLSSNLAAGIDWDDDKLDLFEREIAKLANFYVDHPEIEPIALLDMPINAIVDSVGGKEEVRNYCGTGTGMVAVDPAGKEYPCHTFMPMSGFEGDPDKMLKMLQDQNNNKQDSKCSECFLLAACATCYGMNYSRNKSPFLRSTDDCKIQKIRAMGTAYMWAEMITHRERGYKHLERRSPEELCGMARAIEYINGHLTL